MRCGAPNSGWASLFVRFRVGERTRGARILIRVGERERAKLVSYVRSSLQVVGLPGGEHAACGHVEAGILRACELGLAAAHAAIAPGTRPAAVPDIAAPGGCIPERAAAAPAAARDRRPGLRFAHRHLFGHRGGFLNPPGILGGVKIYTKGGDRGETSLFFGPRVRKDDLRVEAYGSVDELNAVLGLAGAVPSAVMPIALGWALGAFSSHLTGFRFFYS